MFKHRMLQSLEEYFHGLSQRNGDFVYFYRINGFSEAVGQFMERYYEEARRFGVVIEGKIPNPDEKNLAYYNEIMGMDFRQDMSFIQKSLKKWLPRMNDSQRDQVAASMLETLDQMRQDGKNENMTKNAYIKFMCWLYYRFERIVNALGSEKLPKILYEGDISNYELKMITILSHAGCDVLLLQYQGDNSYLALDPHSMHSVAYPMTHLSSFPENFSIQWIRKQMEENVRRQNLYGEPPQLQNCTNAWIKGEGLSDILTSIQTRGSDSTFFYNCFYRINGVTDKLTYVNELYQFYLQFKQTKRSLVIVNQVLTKPDMEEIAQIQRSNYKNLEQMAAHLSGNICFTANAELQKLSKKAFLDVLFEESKKQENLEQYNSLNKLMNRAIYLLCWFKRYQAQLFQNWKPSELGCFIYLGGCQTEEEALFLKMLARLPLDVVILVPNQNQKCCLTDPLLYEINGIESLEVESFPCDNTEVTIGTAAYHAERELDTIMYSDSGMFRSQQCTKAKAIILRTMYEEIAILWGQELKYRPNFSVVDSVVTLPVIFAKVSGIKGGDVSQYWKQIKALLSEDVYLVRKPCCVESTAPNPMKQYATEFLKNGKIQKNKIKSHKAYPYGILRENIQDYLLDKLQLLIDHKLIAGTFENGTEYLIVATILNLNTEIVRLIQKFDFTKKNPKLIYINTTEQVISIEDSILTAFLSYVGFDVVFFVPTGYQILESCFNKIIMEEHQIGEYKYELNVPNFDGILSGNNKTWRDKLFKRGNGRWD